MNAYKTGGCSDREKYLRNQEILYRKRWVKALLLRCFIFLIRIGCFFQFIFIASPA